MTEAFKCDFCGEYKDGSPYSELYENNSDCEGADWPHVADVCASCYSEKIEGGNNDD